MLISELIKKEGWKLVLVNGVKMVEAEGYKFKFTHPALIHLKLYRESKNPESKFLHMKAAHDYFWPKDVLTWHQWTEDRFRAHCEGWNSISLAGGASAAKSYDVAKIAILFWFANPTKRSVTVASVTMDSLQTRVWGYITSLVDKMAIQLPYKYYSSAPMKFLYQKTDKVKRFKIKDDTLHGMFSVTARRGDDESTISTWIGKHPEDAHLLVLDEATDMPLAILKSLANLKTKEDRFQLVDIGNSSSKFDLHGALSTPKDGWRSVDPLKHTRWETTQKNGLCLYFSPYNSPAILEKDPIKRAALGQFLITAEELIAKEKELGKDSEQFWRFVLGFWKDDGTDKTVMTQKFLEEYNPKEMALWSGMYPLQMVAGLDPAFSTGGDKCVLRLAIMGHTYGNKVKLDFRGDSLLFPIKILPSQVQSAEIQIADQTISILRRFGIPLSNLAIDATGQGRALAEVIKLRAQSMEQPFKIYSTHTGVMKDKSFDVIVKTTFELWMSIRRFVQEGQLCGIDDTSLLQFTLRLIEEKGGKYTLESKKSFKTRMGAIQPNLARSPDEADALALCLQAAILKFGFTPGMEWASRLPKGQENDEKLKALIGEKQAQEQIQARRANPPVANFRSEV